MLLVRTILEILAYRTRKVARRGLCDGWAQTGHVPTAIAEITKDDIIFVAFMLADFAALTVNTAPVVLLYVVGECWGEMQTRRMRCS